MSFAKAILVGHLGRDPELRYTPGGKPVATFSLAVNDPRGNGTEADRPTWFRITAWESKAEFAYKHLRKGSAVYVDGPLTAREYVYNGVQRTSLEVTAVTIQFVGSRNSEEPADGQAVSSPEAAETELAEAAGGFVVPEEPVLEPPPAQEGAKSRRKARPPAPVTTNGHSADYATNPEVGF